VIEGKVRQGLIEMCDGEVLFHEPMSNHTSFRIGGPVDVLVAPADEQCLSEVIRFAKAQSIPFYVIGHGTNLLVRDSGVRGLVVKISKVLDELEFDGSKVIVGAGCPLRVLSEAAAQHSLSGLEFAIGIPGVVGGALAMNAGAGGLEIGEFVKWVKVFDTADETFKVLKGHDIWFGQRESFFLENRQCIIARAGLELQEDDPRNIRHQMDGYMEKRRHTQPLGLPSVGSIFKRPKGDYAGRLIEAAGLKGLRKGDAEVSCVHAGWIVNRGDARAKDVLALIDCIQQTVWERFNVSLEPEVVIL